MANHPNRSRSCRPREMLRGFAAHFPDLFDAIAAYRAEHRTEWPPWCYCPAGVAYGHVVGQAYSSAHEFLRANDDAVAIDAELAPILSAWRMGMGVYRFDATLAAALVETPTTALPSEVLLMLPEWCLYVETPWWAEATIGFFACLDYDCDETGAGEPLLRLMFDRGEEPPASYPLLLTAATIDAALEARRQFAVELSRQMHDPHPTGSFGRDGGVLEPLLPGCISLLLYLCSSEPDYQGTDRPKNPSPVKTKKGWRLFPASAPRIWEIGQTVGERLRIAQADRQAPLERAAPRAHLRRAHWHSYWVGKGRTEIRVRWLHPILVGLAGEND